MALPYLLFSLNARQYSLQPGPYLVQLLDE